MVGGRGWGGAGITTIGDGDNRQFKVNYRWGGVGMSTAGSTRWLRVLIQQKSSGVSLKSGGSFVLVPKGLDIIEAGAKRYVHLNVTNFSTR